MMAPVGPARISIANLSMTGSTSQEATCVVFTGFRRKKCWNSIYPFFPTGSIFYIYGSILQSGSCHSTQTRRNVAYLEATRTQFFLYISGFLVRSYPKNRQCPYQGEDCSAPASAKADEASPRSKGIQSFRCSNSPPTAIPKYPPYFEWFHTAVSKWTGL